jgi:Hemerythrin HHE cation binding domain
MTLIEPAPENGVTLLENLISASHARIVDLLLEAVRDVQTPGVQEAVRRQLVHDLRAHLAVVRQVLGPDLSHPEREALDRDHAELSAALDGYEADPSAGAEDLRSLCECVRRHVELEEDSLLPSLRQRAGDQRMATLSFHYGTTSDSHLD